MAKVHHNVISPNKLKYSTVLKYSGRHRHMRLMAYGIAKIF
jgi:hypothetical protein